MKNKKSHLLTTPRTRSTCYRGLLVYDVLGNKIINNER